MKKHEITDALIFHIRVYGLPEPEREYRFHPPRRWRIDAAYPDQRVAIECEGGVWSNGRHTRPSGFVRDMEKYNQLALDGWRLLRFTRKMVDSGEAVQMIAEAIGWQSQP